MRIGAHQSVAGGVGLSVERAEAVGARSLQIFTKSSRAWKAPPLDRDDARRFRAEVARAALPAVAHGSYLVNLASEDRLIRTRSLRCAAEELRRCEALGVPDLILHPGAHPDTRRGLRQVARALNQLHRALPKLRARVCLEVTAGQGNNLGWRFEHLEEILLGVHDPERVGVCLDTCHLFAAGYDLTRPRPYDAAIDACDRRLGLGRVRCIHLNDSKKELGCRVDRHEEIGKGAIGLPTFRRLVNDARFADTVAVLETPAPERYAESIALLHAQLEPHARA